MWKHSIEIYQTLFRFFPDSIDYGLRLARVQQAAGNGKAALATLESLRRLPAPDRDDAWSPLSARTEIEFRGSAKSIGLHCPIPG